MIGFIIKNVYSMITKRTIKTTNHKYELIYSVLRYATLQPSFLNDPKMLLMYNLKEASLRPTAVSQQPKYQNKLVFVSSMKPISVMLSVNISLLRAELHGNIRYSNPLNKARLP